MPHDAGSRHEARWKRFHLLVIGCPVIMRVLVTGVDGFTGYYIKDELQKAGHEVIGLQSNLVDKEDVFAEIATVQPHSVIHLAAISFVPEGDSLDVYSVNTLGTQYLLDALCWLPYELNKIVLASSSIVYGGQGGKLDESVCPRPVNHYGCSKLAMECIAETYMSKLPIVITRPFNYTGVGQSDRFLIPKIVNHYASKKDVIELGNIDVARDFSDVRWVAKAYHALLANGVVGECYNLCSGREFTVSSILEILADITNHKVMVKVNPLFVRDNDIKSQSGDPSKIIDAMRGVKPSSFEDVLGWMVANVRV